MHMILNQEWHVSIFVAMTLCVTINTFIMIYRWILLVHLFIICTLALRQLILAEFEPNVLKYIFVIFSCGEKHHKRQVIWIQKA